MNVPQMMTTRFSILFILSIVCTSNATVHKCINDSSVFSEMMDDGELVVASGDCFQFTYYIIVENAPDFMTRLQIEQITTSPTTEIAVFDYEKVNGVTRVVERLLIADKDENWLTASGCGALIMFRKTEKSVTSDAMTVKYSRLPKYIVCPYPFITFNGEYALHVELSSTMLRVCSFKITVDPKYIIAGTLSFSSPEQSHTIYESKLVFMDDGTIFFWDRNSNAQQDFQSRTNEIVIMNRMDYGNANFTMQLRTRSRDCKCFRDRYFLMKEWIEFLEIPDCLENTCYAQIKLDAPEAANYSYAHIHIYSINRILYEQVQFGIGHSQNIFDLNAFNVPEDFDLHFTSYTNLFFGYVAILKEPQHSYFNMTMQAEQAPADCICPTSGTVSYTLYFLAHCPAMDCVLTMPQSTGKMLVVLKTSLSKHEQITILIATREQGQRTHIFNVDTRSGNIEVEKDDEIRMWYHRTDVTFVNTSAHFQIKDRLSCHCPVSTRELSKENPRDVLSIEHMADCYTLICKFTYYAPKGWRIEVRIDSIDLDPPSDQLLFYSGSRVTPTPLLALTGNKVPAGKIVTSGNVLTVSLLASTKDFHQGFQAQIVAVLPSNTITTTVSPGSTLSWYSARLWIGLLFVCFVSATAVVMHRNGAIAQLSEQLLQVTKGARRSSRHTGSISVGSIKQDDDIEDGSEFFASNTR